MPDDKDAKKAYEELQKKLAEQQKQTAEMLKLMQKNKEMADLVQTITAIQKNQDEMAKTIIKNMK